MTVNTEFARRLQHLREKKRISRRVASELCGLYPGSFRRYERCEREPSASSLKAMSDFFGITMDELWSSEKE